MVKSPKPNCSPQTGVLQPGIARQGQACNVQASLLAKPATCAASASMLTAVTASQGVHLPPAAPNE